MRKWSFQNRLSRAGRLTNNHYVAHNCAAGDWGRFHARATTALKQVRNVAIELLLYTSFSAHWSSKM
jgi:hypothetical protein